MDTAGSSRTELLTSLVFPAYNPGPTVERTWAATRDFLRTAKGAWEVIFVCDGCTDGTPERLRKLTLFAGPRVRVLSYDRNRGKGYAVRHGMLAARGRWRIFTDVDLAYSFDDIQRLAQTLWSSADAAIASREHPGSRLVIPPNLIGYTFRRHIQSRIFAVLARLLLPIHNWDTQAGLKGMSASAAEQVLPHLQCDGFGFDCELLTACSRLNIPVEEVPVRVRLDNTASTTGWRTMSRMIRDLVRIRHLWRNGPPPIAPVETETTPVRRAA